MSFRIYRIGLRSFYLCIVANDYQLHVGCNDSLGRCALRILLSSFLFDLMHNSSDLNHLTQALA
jgi:hypothetical protein